MKTGNLHEQGQEGAQRTDLVLAVILAQLALHALLVGAVALLKLLDARHVVAQLALGSELPHDEGHRAGAHEQREPHDREAPPQPDRMKGLERPLLDGDQRLKDVGEQHRRCRLAGTGR